MPELIKQSGGLVKAHPVDTVSSLKVFVGKWGELERKIEESFGSSVTVVVPASATEGSGSPVTIAVKGRDNNEDDGTGFDVSSDHQPQGAPQNSFSPLSGLSSEECLCFGKRDDSIVVSGEKGEKWSNPITEPMSPSHLDGVKLLQEGPEHLLIQWKHSEVNPSGFFHGEDENGFLECSPLSKWDPNDQKELEVIQEGDEGDVRGVGSSKGTVTSKQKGLRELKGLVSSINYDGVASKGRNGDFSIGKGSVGSRCNRSRVSSWGQRRMEKERKREQDHMQDGHETRVDSDEASSQ
nr:hypothetical protein CFP56_34525 [Quercus suber]